MRNKFNILRKYILENSVKEYRKETVDGLFRSILSPLLSNQKTNSTILFRLNDTKEKESLIKRLVFTNSEIISCNDKLNYLNIANVEKENIWDNTEFVIVLSQRYSAALIWDYDLSDKKDYTDLCLLYNSKLIADIVKNIAENLKYDLKTLFQNYSPERRENKNLNSSLSEIASILNDKNEELIITQQEKEHILSGDDTIKTAGIIAKQAKFIAHEIKNNLSIINLYSAIAKKRLDNIQDEDENIQSIKNGLKNITSASENISSLIGDLRCLSKPYKTEIEIKELIFNTVNMCKEKAIKAGVDIIIEDFSSCNIRADKTNLQCAITNIIYNAIEACKSNCTIRVNCIYEDNVVKIQIKNNGEKITENIIGKIFEPNFTTKEKGNGLGLYICKKQLGLTGGDVNLLYSNEQETVFEIKLI